MRAANLAPVLRGVIGAAPNGAIKHSRSCLWDEEPLNPAAIYGPLALTALRNKRFPLRPLFPDTGAFGGVTWQRPSDRAICASRLFSF
jgi:hypothetical protein